MNSEARREKLAVPQNFTRCKTAAQQKFCCASKLLTRRKTGFDAPQNSGVNAFGQQMHLLV
jgi:hypothetical protein